MLRCRRSIDLVMQSGVRMLYSRKEVRADQNRKAKNNPHDLTVHIPDLVGHGEADDVVCVVHDKHLVHSEHLRGPHVSQSLAVLAAPEGDGLTPLVGPGLGGAVG